MALIKRDRDEGNPEVPMTPMIDMVFLLLIFFLVTASLKKPHKELAIDLPNVGHAKMAKYQEEFIISVTADGDWYVDDGDKYRNQAPVHRHEMIKLLQTIANERPDLPIRLDIDRRVQYFHLMDMMDTLELYGLRNVQLRSKHSFADEKQ